MTGARGVGRRVLRRPGARGYRASDAGASGGEDQRQQENGRRDARAGHENVRRSRETRARAYFFFTT